MSDLDVEALLQPISEEQPCGADLEYDAAFGELERTAQGKEERIMGDSVIAAEDPDWADVAEQAAALLTQTKDCRIAVLLAQAEVERNGLTGLAAGLELIYGLLDRYWENVYPLLDADDDDDPILRMNSLLPLNDRAGFVKSVVSVPIVSAPSLGRFSLRNVKLAAGDIDPVGDEERTDQSHIDGAFMAAELEELQSNDAAATRAAAALDQIESLLAERVGSLAPSLDLLLAELTALTRTFASQLQRRGIGSGVEEQADTATDGASAAVVVASGEILNREDAIRSIDKICEYFRQNEPSSPVPMLLNRAKRLISKDFVEILRDLTPGGVDEAMLIGGISEEES